jgi:hypothetical protein
VNNLQQILYFLNVRSRRQYVKIISPTLLHPALWHHNFSATQFFG